jgi:hypothetical protein
MAGEAEAVTAKSKRIVESQRGQGIANGMPALILFAPFNLERKIRLKQNGPVAWRW